MENALSSMDLAQLHFFICSEVWKQQQQLILPIYARYLELTEGQAADPNAFGTPAFRDALCTLLLGDDASQSPPPPPPPPQQQQQPGNAVRYF